MDFRQLVAIATDVIAPVIVMAGVGYVVGALKIVAPAPVAKLYMTVFAPALVLKAWLGANLGGGDLTDIFLFCFISVGVLHVLSYGISRAMGHDRGMRGAFVNSVILYNSANYGLAVQAMAFPKPAVVLPGAGGHFGEVIQPLVLVTQQLVAFTIGAFNAASNRPNLMLTLKQLLLMPITWALAAGALLHSSGYTWTALREDYPIVWSPLNYFQGALVPVALLSLGVQLSQVRISGKVLNIVVGCLLRLLVGPLVGVVVGYLLGIRGDLYAILVVSLSFPSAVFSSVLATEFGNHEDYAAAVVFLSTVISVVTVTVVIFLSQTHLAGLP